MLNGQTLNHDTFFRPPVSSAQYNILTEKYTDADIYSIHCDHTSSQCYIHIEEAFRCLTKDEILQPFISDQHSRSFNLKMRVQKLIINFIFFRETVSNQLHCSSTRKGNVQILCKRSYWCKW